MAAVIYLGVLFLLTINHVSAFFAVFDGYYGLPRDILYNLVSFIVYPVLSYISIYYFSISKKRVFLYAILVFSFEHFVLKIIHLKFSKYGEMTVLEFFQKVEGLDVLAYSFLMFVPVVMLLSFFGILIASKRATLTKSGSKI